MKTPAIVSPREWRAAHEKLLVKAKELTRARDALAAERRRMPWMPVEKEYRFEGVHGQASLLDLFEGRRQLIIYHFFYAQDVTTTTVGGTYPERGCIGCSLLADQVAHPAHLNARDTTLAFVSRAPKPRRDPLRSVRSLRESYRPSDRARRTIGAMGHARRRHTPEQIIRKLREADRLLGEGQEVALVAKQLEVSEQTLHGGGRSTAG